MRQSNPCPRPNSNLHSNLHPRPRPSLPQPNRPLRNKQELARNCKPELPAVSTPIPACRICSPTTSTFAWPRISTGFRPIKRSSIVASWPTVPTISSNPIELLEPLIDQVTASGNTDHEKLLRQALAEDYLRLGDWAKAAEAYQALDMRLQAKLSPDEQDEIEMPLKMLPLAKDNPPMTAEPCDPFMLQVSRRSARPHRHSRLR